MSSLDVGTTSGSCDAVSSVDTGTAVDEPVMPLPDPLVVLVPPAPPLTVIVVGAVVVGEDVVGATGVIGTGDDGAVGVDG